MKKPSLYDSQLGEGRGLENEENQENNLKFNVSKQVIDLEVYLNKQSTSQLAVPSTSSERQHHKAAVAIKLTPIQNRPSTSALAKSRESLGND